MGEVSQGQVLDLLFEIADGMDRLDARLGEVLVEMRALDYEMASFRQSLSEVSLRFSGKVSPA